MIKYPKITFLLVLIFLFFSKPLMAQKNKDSLNYYLAIINDKTKHFSTDSVLQIYQKTRNLADAHTKVLLLRKEASLLVDRGFQRESLMLLDQALDLSKKNNYRTFEALIYQGYGYYYYNFNDFLQSYQYLLKSKNLLEQLNEEDIAFYNRKSKKNITKEFLLQTSLFNIGTIALVNEEYDNAEQFFKEARLYSIKTNDSIGVLDADINLASLLYEKKNYIEAINAFNEFLYDKHLDKGNQSIAYFNIAMAYADMDSLQKARYYVDKAIAVSTEIKDKIALTDLAFFKSQIEGELGNYAAEKELLIDYLNESLRVNDTKGQIESYNALAIAEENLGNYKKATFWYKKERVLQDSINKKNYQNNYKNIELENKYLLQQQKNQFQEQVIENEKAKVQLYNVIAILLGVIGITLLAIWYFNKRINYKRLKIEEQKRKIQRIKQENQRRLEVLETERIQADLKEKKREILVSLLFVKKRNEKLQKIIKEIDRISSQSIITKENLLYIKNRIITMSNTLSGEENVQQQLVNTHKYFFHKLLQDYPKLTKTELKILAYLRVGLSTKEIAEIQYVSVDAIRKSRYRIRKKMGLRSDESLEKLILQYH